MSRTPVSVRPALPVDAPVLARLWSDVLRRGSHEQQAADVTAVIDQATGRSDCLVVVAEYDGRVAGAVHLRATTLSPLNLEPTCYAVSPHVLPEFRRHGVGSALMEAAVRFAEDHGVALVATAANADWRDANRFFARLALAPQAMLRVSPTHQVRARLAGRPRRMAGPRPASIDRVLAARRSRRAERVSAR
jgi:GNAT superfamily N-acetyltransferase